MASLGKALPSAVSAILLLLSQLVSWLWPLTFVALIPLLWSLRSATGKGAWRGGYTMGVLYGIGQFHWLYVLVARWTGNQPLAVLPWVLCALAYALYFGLAAVLMRKCWAKGWPWLIPVAWAGVEVFRSYIPVFAFPWGLLASPLWRAPVLIQPAYYGAIFLVSAAAVGVSIALIQVRERENWRPVGVAMLVLAVLSGVHWFREPGSAPMRVTVVQPGVDMAFGDPALEWSSLYNAITPALVQATELDSDLVVLPEGISDQSIGGVPSPPFHATPGLPPILFGGKRGESPVYQSAFLYESGRWSHADKTRLVIFGEFVPGRSWIPFLTAFNLPSGDIAAGDSVGTLTLGGTTLGPVICFEGLFPDIPYRQSLQGAQLLAIISIDDWYMGTSAPDQLRAGAVWRAVENGLPLVRSASLGYTMIVDSRGRIVEEAPLRQTTALHHILNVPTRPQALSALPVFPVASLLVAFGLLFVRISSPRAPSPPG